MRGELVLARVPGERGKHKGFVHRVERERSQLVLGFGPALRYQWGQTVDIEFTFSRTKLRLQHAGCKAAATCVFRRFG